MEKINLEDKLKQNYNEIHYNSNQTSEETDPKEKYKKKNFQRYKFHIFHHNNLLEKIKSTGFNMNIVDSILNSNHALIYQLLKNNQENEISKNNNMQISDMNKAKSNLNDNEAMNILQSQYEDIIKKCEKDNNDNMSENLNIKEEKRRSFENNNPYNFPLKLDEFTKIKYITGTKGKESVDLTSDKKLFELNEANNFKLSPTNKGINLKSSLNKFKKLSFPIFFQKDQKKSNSSNDILLGNSNSNNSLNNNNKDKISLFKNTLTNLRKNKKVSYINNKIRPYFYKKRNRSKSVLFNTTHIKYGVNFKKMLSRDYLNRLSPSKIDGVYSTCTPNYEYIEPKCVMKVSYTNKRHSMQNSSFKGLGPEATFNMDKLFFKYNNHNPPKSFYLEKMAGRGKYLKNKLPIFMLNQVDRNSCISFNEKNLKMNFYSNGHLQQIISCFDNKKSFNFKLNDKPEEKTEDQINFENYAKQIFEKGIINNDNEAKTVDEEGGGAIEKKIINSIPFRVNSLFKNFMSEYKRNGSYSEKIDGVTFKNFKIANKIRTKKLI